MKEKPFNLTNELLSGIADAICTEVGSGVIDGVHYISIKDTPRNEIVIKRLLHLRVELDAEKKNPKEVLEMIKVSNGYVFIFDKALTYYLFNSLVKLSKTNDFDDLLKLIPSRPDAVIENEKLKIAKLCNHMFYKKKKDSLDVCLYNASDTDKTYVSAVTNDGGRVLVMYNSFRLTQNDLDDVNKRYLSKKEMRISGSQIYEILDDCVLVRLTLDNG